MTNVTAMTQVKQGCQELYRVYDLLVDLGWVDLDLGVPPS